MQMALKDSRGLIRLHILVRAVYHRLCLCGCLVFSDTLYEAFSIRPRKMTSTEKADKNIELEVSNNSITSSIPES
jgi:hypothetical protein